MLYQPHDYQKYATHFIVEHPVAAVLLQMVSARASSP